MNKYEEAYMHINEHFCGYCRESNCTKCVWHKDLKALGELVDKTAPKVFKTAICDLHNKCGACIHCNYETAVNNLYECECRDKPSRGRSKLVISRTAKACKHYKERNDRQLVYEYRKGIRAGV